MGQLIPTCKRPRGHEGEHRYWVASTPKEPIDESEIASIYPDTWSKGPAQRYNEDRG